MCAALGLLLTLALPPTVSRAVADPADPTAGCTGTWQPAKELSARLVVDCRPGFASEHDRLFVYPRHPHLPGGDWRAALDVGDAVWLFDAGSLGRASLIVDFHPDTDGTGAVADLYDDTEGRGGVAYRLVSGIPSASWPFPTVRVRAPEGWWVRDGLVDYDLDITVDGPVRAAFGSDRYADLQETDGVPDARIRVRDDDRDGRPDWELVAASPPLPASSAVIRGELMVSPRGDAPITGSIFWPLLGIGAGLRLDTQGRIEAAPAPPGDAYGIVKDYNRSPPPIQMDWSRAKIAAVGEIVASRGAEDNWFVYSLTPLGAAAQADFENPFAFYDLAGIHDGYPDLAIRHEYYPARDPYVSGGRSPGPSELVRYSWDQEHRHERWSYKLDLLGRHAVASAQRVGDVPIPTLPHDTLPAWVGAQRWDVAQFVATTTGGWTSEGIAEEPVDMLRARDGYLAGIDSTPPSLDASRVPVGYRGELSARLDDQPWLAISAVDHQLHLARAEAGVWRVSGSRVVRYASLTGGGIDSWSVEDDGRETSSLYALSGQLVLADSAGVRVRTLGTPLEAARLLPPSSHDTWTELGEELRAAQPSFSGDDLTGMFDQFSGPVDALPRASLRDVRATPAGFRFVLDVHAGGGVTSLFKARDPRSAGACPPPSPARATALSSSGDGGGQAPALRTEVAIPAGVCPDLLELSGVAPGPYLVHYQEQNGYTVESATTPALAVSTIEVSGPEVAALEPASLSVTIRNTGRETAHGVVVTLLASRAGSTEAPAGSATLDVPGDGEATARVAWTPPSGGAWIVRAVAEGAPLPGAPLRVAVAPAPAVDLAGLLGAQRERWLPAAAAAVLAVAAILACCLMGATLAARSSAPAAKDTGDPTRG